MTDPPHPPGIIERQARRLRATASAAVSVFTDPGWTAPSHPNGHASALYDWARTYSRVTPPFDPALASMVPAPDPGDENMTAAQIAFVSWLAGEAPVRRYLEVGVYHGRTTVVLASHGPTVALDWFQGNEEAAVTPWRPNRMETDHRLIGFLRTLRGSPYRDRVTVITGSSHVMLPTLKNDVFGLVLIDGDHSEDGAYADIRDVWDLIVPGGWLLLDDFSAALIRDEAKDSVVRAWGRFSVERGLRLPLVGPDAAPPKLVAVQKPSDGG